MVNPSHKGNRTDYGFEHTFLHEMTHAVTMQAVTQGGPAVENLKVLVNNLKRTYNSGDLEISEGVDQMLKYIFKGVVQGKAEYNVTDTHILQEFTAYAMSNQEFQGFLKEQPYVIKGKNLWEKFVETWAAMAKALGIEVGSENMLAAAMNDVIALTDQGRVTSTKESVTETESKFDEISDLPSYSDQDVVTLNTLANMGLLKTTSSTIEEAITAKKNC